MRHVPVLLHEVIEMLCLKPGAAVVDCTLGDAGHSEEMLKAIGQKGKLIGLDADPEALLRAKQYLYAYEQQITLVRENFSELQSVLENIHIKKVDAIVMDLGWSTPQFEERGRGFSFEKDEPLDMRYQGAQSAGKNSVTAADIVNESDFDDLYRILRMYGEEDLSKEITESILDTRREKRIERTSELSEIVLAVYRKKLKTDKPVPWIGGIHPATKVFQALRIAVNKEFEVLKAVLPQAVEALNQNGRLAIITFHSLEDRIVKHYFKSLENKTIKLINKKPVVAGSAEIEHNPRSSSAKLRVIEKL